MLGIDLSRYFLDTGGLYALLWLVPFIILYIIKPKPKKIIIPSLMFFIKDRDKSNLNSFLQRFVQDIIFYIQLLILLLLALSFARPYIVVPSISYADSVVFVIDGSASMNAVEDGKTRFERAREAALERVEGKNSIIVATDTSELMLENGNAKDAREALQSLQPRETKSSLYDSIVLAEQFCGKENSMVFVISDFSTDTLEKEFLRAKGYLESKGIKVFFKDVSLNKARNIGIIDMDIKDTETTVWIKNFNSNPEKFSIKYGDKVIDMSLEANDVKSITVPNLNGKSKIELNVNDDFKADNYAYISTPEDSSLNLMMISNRDDKYLLAALDIMNKVRVSKNSPPIVSFNNPDIIVLGDVDKGIMLPGQMTKIKELCREEGVPLVVLAQDNLVGLGLGDALPLELDGTTEPVSVTDTLIPANKDSYLTPSEIQFGIIRKMYRIKNNPNVEKYAITKSGENPVITINLYGKCKVMYYGLFEDYSDFKSDIFYPIFWKRSLDYLMGGKTLAELDKKTGYIAFLPKEQTVITPKGKKQGASITLDYTGFYDLKGYSIAANLIDETEERLNRNSLEGEQSKLDIESMRASKETKEREITYTLLTVVSVLLALELIYLKIRGDV